MQVIIAVAIVVAPLAFKIYTLDRDANVSKAEIVELKASFNSLELRLKLQ